MVVGVPGIVVVVVAVLPVATNSTSSKRRYASTDVPRASNRTVVDAVAYAEMSKLDDCGPLAPFIGIVIRVVHGPPVPGPIRTRTLPSGRPWLRLRHWKPREAVSAPSRSAVRSIAIPSMLPPSLPMRRQFPVPPAQRSSDSTRRTPAVGPSASERSRQGPEKDSDPSFPPYPIDRNSSRNVVVVCATAAEAPSATITIARMTTIRRACVVGTVMMLRWRRPSTHLDQHHHRLVR